MLEDSKRIVWFGIGAIAGAAAALSLCRRQSAVSDPPAPGLMTIREIRVFPIKAVSGRCVQTAKLVEGGFEWDRRWVIIKDSDSAIVGQIQCPKVKLATAWVEDGHLVVTCHAIHGDRVLRVPVDAVDDGGEERRVDKNGAIATCRSVGREANDFFSAIVGERVLLVRATEPRFPVDIGKHQGTCARPTDTLAMQSFSTVHAITTEGIRWLEEQVGSGTKLDYDRFRPNILLEGVPFPDEDTWNTLLILPSVQRRDAVTLRAAKPTGRCTYVTIDDHANIDPRDEPKATLKRLRSCMQPHQEARDYPGRKPDFMFGIDFFHDGVGVVSVGDKVAIASRKPPLTFYPPPTAS